MRKAELPIGVASFAVHSWADALSPEKATEKLLADANDGERRALRLVQRLTNDGVTPSIIDRIGRRIRQLPMAARPVPVPIKLTFEWQIQLQDSRHISDEQFTYLLLFLVISSGYASGIKKCEFIECEKPYFHGNRKAKYCSDKCGSNVRARKMRKNQKASQML